MCRTACYHLPGLFEFYELYRAFLPLYREHRDWFYPWCGIGSLYGAPADCLWGGGRAGFGDNTPREALALLREYGISARLTFSNSLLQPEHLHDTKCNRLCRLFAESQTPQNGVIEHSDLLLDYLKTNYPSLYFVSSTTKVLTDYTDFLREVQRPEFRFVVPDFRLNKALDRLQKLPAAQKDKVEFFVQRVLRFRLHGAQSLLRGGQPQKSGAARRRASLPRTRRRAGVSVFRRDAKSRFYQRAGHPKHLPAAGVFAV